MIIYDRCPWTTRRDQLVTEENPSRKRALDISVHGDGLVVVQILSCYGITVLGD